jgi:ribosomal protein S18 acetylase RimI-like enzyme
MALRIRPATKADARDLVRVINEAFVVERFFIDRERTSLDAVEALLTRGRFLVGEDSRGHLVACAQTEQRGDHGYFGLLAVAPAFKGLGYGRALIEAVEAHFRAAGCRQVDIRVVNLRTELPPLYRRLGYVQTGTEPFEDPRALQPAHFILMSKPL